MYKKESVVSVRQGDIAIVELGDPDGVPVFGLHGWLDNAASFYPVAQYLSGIRLIAVDLAGHGKSYHRNFPHNYNIWDDLIDILDLADHLGLEEFAVAAHSRGASIANLLAATSERVNKMALIDGFLFTVSKPDQTTDNLSDYLAKRMRGRLRLMRYKSLEEMAKTRLTGAIPTGMEASMLLTERNAKRMENGTYTWSTDQALRWRSAMHVSTEQAKDVISNISCPTRLWLAGTKYYRNSTTLPFIQANPNIDIVEVDGPHHFHMEGGEERLGKEMSEFFQQ